MTEAQTLTFERPAKPVPGIKPAFYKGMSLHEMIYGKQNDETGEFTLTDEDKAEIFAGEVDAFKYAIDQAAAQKKLHEDYAKAHKWSAELAERRAEKLKELFVEYFDKLKAEGVEKPTGQEFRCHLGNSEAVEIIDSTYKTPTKEFFESFPEFVKERKTYDWSITALKQAIKAGTHKIAFATVKPKRFPVFNHK